MFLTPGDLPELAANPPPVVIVGTGPAGMSLAMALASKGIASLLVEAGPRRAALDPEPYQGSSGERPYPLGASRLRHFGGTSGHWGGWCRPLDPVDFAPVEGVPHTGWPITREQAYAHLAKAHEVLEIPDARYDEPDVLAAARETALPLPEASGFHTRVFRFSPPTRFGRRYRDDIENSPLIHCALRTALVAVKQVQGKVRLVLRGPDGKDHEVAPAASVLAMGGIENARHLLWSQRRHGLSLPGSDWVGRCFLDHCGLAAARVIAQLDLNYGRRDTVVGNLMPVIVPDAERIAQGRAPSHMFILNPVREESFLQPGYGGAGFLFGGEAQALQAYELIAVSGQRPNRDSRILLGDDVDSLGMPRVVVDWRVNSADFAGVFASVADFGRQLAASGLGRLRKTGLIVPEPNQALSAGMHHIGTTRMARSESEGVVDVDGKVFGTQDLYVAGSSVFPTGGFANPTLTIVSLALRLAEHLADRLGGTR